MPRLKKEIAAYQWALPEGIKIPADELRVRLDFYEDSIILYLLDKGIITTRMVSARDIALAVLSEVPLNSGILPSYALWWKQGRNGVEVALWRPAMVWQVALQAEPFKPALRFKLPMPGLIFICSPSKPPAIYAAKKRPKSTGDIIYHAPLFNVYRDGSTCPGSHKYPKDINQIPEDFFTSFFTLAASPSGRSKKYPNNLDALWKELDDKKRYPLGDLVKLGTVGDILR